MKEKEISLESLKPIEESKYLHILIDKLKDSLEKYISIHNEESLIPFKDQLLKDLVLFGEGKDMEYEYCFYISVRAGRECRYIEFNFERGIIEVSCGGSVYDPRVGSDSYMSWFYSLDIDGIEDASMVCEDSFYEIYFLLIEKSSRFNIDEPEEYRFNSDTKEEKGRAH